LLPLGWMSPWQWKRIPRQIKLLAGCLKCEIFVVNSIFVNTLQYAVDLFSFPCSLINTGMLMLFHLLYMVLVTSCTRTSWFRFNLNSISMLCHTVVSKIVEHFLKLLHVHC
jgi:hypothetical protein